MERKTLSLVLTAEQYAAIRGIAKEQYAGNIGQAIRAAMEKTYPAIQKAEKIGRVGPKLGKRVK